MSEPGAVRTLLGMCRRYWLRAGMRLRAACAVALVAVVAATDVGCPLAMQHAIDALTELGGSAGARYAHVLRDAAVIGVLVLIQYVAHYGVVRLQDSVIVAGATTLRVHLYEVIDRRVLAGSREALGELTGRFVGDVQVLQESLSEFLSDIPFDVAILLGLTVAAFVLNPYLGALVLAFIAAVLGLAALMSRPGWDAHRIALDAAGRLSAQIGESAGAARTIAASGASSDERTAFAEGVAAHGAAMLTASRVRAVVTPFYGLSEYAGLALVLVIGGSAVAHGQLTIGGLVALLAYMEMAVEPLGRCGRLLPRLQRAAAAASRIAEMVFESQASPAAAPGGGAAPDAGLVVDDLWFTYPGAARPALRGISFTLAAGERLAVIGRNGAGKSTLIEVLCGLRRPDRGRLLIGGRDVSALELEQRSQLVGTILQDVLILNRSLADNIALGLKDRTAVEAAAHRAGLDDLIQRLPAGLNAVVGERGAELSGGLRQRLAIARFLARTPSLAVLDEPTAALDAVSEAEVVAALETACRGRTCVIVSHRHAPIQRVDRVLLLEDGAVRTLTTPRAAWEAFADWRDLFPKAWGETPD